MRMLRSVAYAIIAICACMCLIILLYRGRKDGGEVSAPGASVEASVDNMVIVNGDDVSLEEIKDAANAIISDAAETVKDLLSTDKKDEKKEEKGKENTTGVISYDEIVRLQNEALDSDFRQALRDYYKENGISIVVPEPSKDDTSKVTPPEKNYVVNKNLKVIHRIGCMLEPAGSNALYYETLTAAKKDGYIDKCVVCSP